jgi:transposase-like protein
VLLETAPLNVASEQGGCKRNGEKGDILNGSPERALWCPTGVEEGFRVPRGQYCAGERKELHSQVLGRYQRRAGWLNELVIEFSWGACPPGSSPRALRPLFKGTGLSRSTVSKIGQEVGAKFKAWRERALSALTVVYGFLEGFGLPVRHVRVERQALLVAHGVLEDGSRVLLRT